MVVAVVTPEPTEIDRIDPVAEPITLSDGTKVDIEPLATRQFFRLLRILTRGGANVFSSVLSVRADMGDSEFVGQIMALIIFAIPEAENETIEFLRSMVKPHGPFATDDEEAAAYVHVFNVLENPDLDDTFTVIEAVITREAGDLKALGKRLRRVIDLFQKTGQDKTPAAPTKKTAAKKKTPVS